MRLEVSGLDWDYDYNKPPKDNYALLLKELDKEPLEDHMRKTIIDTVWNLPRLIHEMSDIKLTITKAKYVVELVEYTFKLSTPVSLPFQIPPMVPYHDNPNIRYPYSIFSNGVRPDKSILDTLSNI